MNNEPVAYGMFVGGDFWDAIHADEYKRVEGKYDIPLYTHPAKELTDEEKWKLWGECPNGLVYDRVMMFADLVLRKANEK